MVKKVACFAAAAAGAVILLVAAVWGIHFLRAEKSEWPSRLAWYHSLGEVKFFVDGKRIDLNENSISLNLHDGKRWEHTKFRQNSFRFRKIDYGKITLLFTVQAEGYCIPVSIEYVNIANWHVNHYTIEISANMQAGTVTAGGQVQAITEREPHPFNSITIPLDNAAIYITAYGLS